MEQETRGDWEHGAITIGIPPMLQALASKGTTVLQSESIVVIVTAGFFGGTAPTSLW